MAAFCSWPGWTCRKRRLTNKKTFSNGGNPWWIIRDSRELDIARHQGKYVAEIALKLKHMRILLRVICA
ncbi:TPA: hypothetical protein GF860_07335 [Citrobacter koseri]|nr:hypothetical protein [Citrobacter koseri]